MAEAWGPWINWGGAFGVAERKGVYVQLYGNNGEFREGIIDNDRPEVWANVDRYRVRKPDALRNLIDLAESVENLRPETIKALVGV